MVVITSYSIHYTKLYEKDNVMRIVEKLHTEVSGGKYDFDVELKPDFLGKVNIKLTMENGRNNFV